MLAKNIKYTDYDGNEREETFYFNISKAELMEMELVQDGGMVKFLENIVKTLNNKEIVDTFKTIIKVSYGVKSPDGKRLIKTPEVWEEFSQTEAYSNLFVELATEDQAASEFINGIIPKNAGESSKTKSETSNMV